MNPLPKIGNLTIERVAYIEQREQAEWYGFYPRCQTCSHICRMRNVPGLLRLVCEKSPDYEAEQERLNAG
jgi:hypothetical protein